MGHSTIAYLRFLMPIILIISAWRYGDWNNWKRYYPSVLFYICVSFGVSYLTDDYPLWRFNKSFLIPNHKTADFLLTFTAFPSIILLYLSHFPLNKSWTKQVFYIIYCAVSLSILEGIFRFGNLILYYNGWNYWWSVVVWVFMMFGLRLHFSKPIWAWLMCFGCIAFLITFFHIPVTKS